ncbi:MAG: hypothetical protein E7182_04190 [Erysipelotrichaceae bacterium]|nr:hypothetical protein [Erysipelotrichaceae bacterium]
MPKRYIRYTIRHWWPMLLIFGIICTVVFGLTCLMLPTYYKIMYYPNGGQTTIPATIAPGIGLLVLGLLGSVVMSLFVFTYRTRKQSVDVYYQAAYKPTTVKRVRMFTGLGILHLALLIGFITGLIIYGIRFLATPELRELPYTDYVRLNVNFGGFFLGYLLAAVTMTAQYFINCFLVSLGNYMLDQIFLLLFGNILLVACIFSPALYLVAIIELSGSLKTFPYEVLAYGFGPVGSFYLDTVAIERLTNGVYTYNANETNILIHSIASTSIYLLFGAGLGVLTSMIPDPSGEFADVATQRNKAITMIPHGAALTIGILLSLVGIVSGTGPLVKFGMPIFLYLLFGVVYFALLALWRHSFKPSKTDLVCYLSVMGATLVLLIVMMALSGAAVYGRVNY